MAHVRFKKVNRVPGKGCDRNASGALVQRIGSIYNMLNWKYRAIWIKFCEIVLGIGELKVFVFILF